MENFSILFQCNDGNCWPGGLDFTATASTPEPGTMALLATGIGALWTPPQAEKRRTRLIRFLAVRGDELLKLGEVLDLGQLGIILGLLG